MPAADLFPEKGAELVAHDPVQNSAGLIGIDEVDVDLTDVVDTFDNGLFGDLVKSNPVFRLGIKTQKL